MGDIMGLRQKKRKKRAVRKLILLLVLAMIYKSEVKRNTNQRSFEISSNMRR